MKMYGDYDKVRRLGHFVCAINPAMFTDPDQFKSDVDKMIEEIQRLQPAEGFEKVMVPGQPEQEKESERLQNGVPITKSVYQFLAEEELQKSETNETLI
jgi:ureidoglycolate dehydrogenase (NAD+)